MAYNFYFYFVVYKNDHKDGCTGILYYRDDVGDAGGCTVWYQYYLRDYYDFAI